MSKKHKQTKWKNLPSTVRTCIIGTAIFMVIGIGLFLYGSFGRGVSSVDIKSVPAEIVSIDKVQSNLPTDQEKYLREKGFDEGYIKYELKVVYRYNVDGEEYTYEDRQKMDKAGSFAVGDTDVLRYAYVNGKVVVDPDTDSTYKTFGIVFIILGIISGIVGYVLLPKRKKS